MAGRGQEAGLGLVGLLQRGGASATTLQVGVELLDLPQRPTSRRIIRLPIASSASGSASGSQ